MSDITLEQVMSICGEYKTKSGSNYYFRCPICASEGHDKHGDNLIFNSTKGLVKCFVGDDHAKEILRDINKKFNIKKENIKPRVEIVKQWELNKEKYLEYMCLANEYLLNNEELLKYLFDKRRIRKETVELCGIGFDYTENCFIFPIFSLKHDCITDFEMRKKTDKKQIRRVGGGCNTIAKIYGNNKADTLYITEGLIDGYTLVEWLLSKNKNDFTVYSCSNGVSSLFNVMDEINFKNFKNIKLILDNDKAGNDVTKKIIDKYSFIIDSRTFLIKNNYKDISEYFRGKNG